MGRFTQNVEIHDFALRTSEYRLTKIWKTVALYSHESMLPTGTTRAHHIKLSKLYDDGNHLARLRHTKRLFLYIAF